MSVQKAVHGRLSGKREARALLDKMSMEHAVKGEIRIEDLFELLNFLVENTREKQFVEGWAP